MVKRKKAYRSCKLASERRKSVQDVVILYAYVLTILPTIYYDVQTFPLCVYKI